MPKKGQIVEITLCIPQSNLRGQKSFLSWLSSNSSFDFLYREGIAGMKDSRWKRINGVNHSSTIGYHRWHIQLCNITRTKGDSGAVRGESPFEILDRFGCLLETLLESSLKLDD